MSKFGKLTKIATGVSAALLMSYGVPARADITAVKPSAYAESELIVSNFRINNAAGTLTPADFASLTAVVNAQAPTASISPTGVLGPTATIFPLLGPASFDVTAAVGAYVPYVSYPINTMGPGVFAGANAYHIGNALDAGNPTIAKTQAIVNINNSVESGAANAAQTLNTEFGLDIGQGGLFTVSFLADMFQRAALGQDGAVADSVVNWGLKVFLDIDPTAVKNFVEVLSWNPNGILGSNLGTCTGVLVPNPGPGPALIPSCGETDDDFSLNSQIGTLTTDDLVNPPPQGDFGIYAFLNPGNYKFTIGHTTFVNAASIAQVPEPASLALLGLGLAGLGFARRKKQ